MVMTTKRWGKPKLQTGHDLRQHLEFFALYQGVKAGETGKENIECPYKEGTREYHLFIKGIRYGKDKHERPRATRPAIAGTDNTTPLSKERA
jgi:ribosome modulation factor